MRTHDLKTWPDPFEAVLDGRKRFEVRVDDRGFAVGDLLRLREWDPAPSPSGRERGYTGRELLARVPYIFHGGRFGLPGALCVMSIFLVADEADRRGRAS